MLINGTKIIVPFFVYSNYFSYLCKKKGFYHLEQIRINGESQEIFNIRQRILTEFQDLTFVEKGHKYFLNGVQLPSVSSVTHKFQPPFNEQEVAENYALKHGETARYWLDQWKYKSLKATTTGTLVHAYGESLGWLRNGHAELITEDNRCKYIPNKGWLIPTRPKEEAILKFYDELHPNLHFVLAETKVYTNKGEASMVKNQFCGTFDLLMYYEDKNNPTNSGLVIFDYKTNSSLIKDFSRERDKMLLPPFGNMYDEPLSLYTLQLSCYAMCLRGIGLDIKGLRLIWLKDDGEYELIKLKDLSRETWFKEVF